MAAIFIAVFLFFLSVALIWTNRQDIALTLSLEHRLKAESAARSAALEAFARLRQMGSLEDFSGLSFSDGAKAEVELLSLPAEGKRGEVMLLRSKGTSGPLNSYLTFYLREVKIAGEDNAKDGRVLFFPAAGEGGSGGKAMFGDFLLKDGGDVRSDMTAQGGPAFVPRDLAPKAEGASAPSPPYFVDYIPVFSQDGQSLRAWGPTYVVAPPFAQQPYSITSIQYLKSVSDTDWTDIAPPEKLGDEDQKLSSAQGVLEMSPITQDLWTEAKIRGIGDSVSSLAWLALKPETQSVSDLPADLHSGQPVQPGPLIDWSEAGKASVQNKYVTRGKVAASGDTVYTHGWHYLYRPYTGSATGEITPLLGSTLTRWPCILKCKIGGDWSIVWDPLKASGSVDSDSRPDPNIIAVAENGTVYSVTVPAEGRQRRLLTISEGGKASVGNEVPAGTLFAYKNQPYLVPQESSAQGLLNLADQSRIDFSTLPDFLPEISGEVVDTSEAEQLIVGLEGGYQGEALDSSVRRTVTASPRFDFTYSMPAGLPVAVDGNDLWANITITSEAQDPSYPKAYTETELSTEKQSLTVLARYDGKRWHVFPHGLRAALKSRLPAPGQGVLAAVYPDLPKQVSRYSVISIDTTPFQEGVR